MYVERPRVCFHGCYISKTSYVRYGERSFQDQFYRPVHLVEYYRYMRFFPDGSVLMITSTDEPAQVVGKLQNKNRNDILRGHYRYSDNIIIVELKKNLENQRRIRNYSDFDRNERSFYLQLEIGFTKKRRTPQLVWNQYSVSFIARHLTPNGFAKTILLSDNSTAKQVRRDEHRFRDNCSQVSAVDFLSRQELCFYC